MVEYRGTDWTALNRGAAVMDAGPGPPVVRVTSCGVSSDKARFLIVPKLIVAAGYPAR